jgi:hypothetical protein
MAMARVILGVSLALAAAAAAFAQPAPNTPPPAAQPAPYAPGERGREVLEKADEVLGKAGKIVTQPARDVGASKVEIPPILVAAAEKPYDLAGLSTCQGLSDEVARLTEVLGPDFDAKRAEGENKSVQVAEAGGKAVMNSLIPFRGLVREVSGAAPAQRALNAALDAGLARRGYLRGVHHARGCKTPV